MSNVTAKFTVNPRKAIEIEFKLNVSNMDHNVLYNRDLPGQHPISAITGLEEIIENLPTKEYVDNGFNALSDDITAENQRALNAEEALSDAIDGKQDILTSENAGTGISIETVGGVVKINNTQNSAEWGQIGGDINQQTDLKTALDNKQDNLTQTQLDAVNSGITNGLVAKISTNETTINNHIANTSNPHSVTKAQVGLGNVDNTSDLNKPISTATQTALNGKQATLVSGTNIKTINNQSLLGSGNIDIQGGGAVDSVNGQTGVVVLTASDVGALPDSTVIPTEATVSGWGFTKNVGTVTSVNNVAPVNGNVSLSIPTVNNATLTIQKNGTNVATFTANASSNVTANIGVPNTVSSVSSSSTNADAVGAKLFYDTCGDIEALINAL